MRNTAILLLLFVLSSTGAVHAQEGLRAGVKAPAFTLPIAGEERTVSLQSYAGKNVVILHFWKSK